MLEKGIAIIAAILRAFAAKGRSCAAIKSSLYVHSYIVL